MHKTLTTLLALTLCLTAGCGGDDDKSSEAAKAHAETEKAAGKAPASGVPSYEQVKALALEDPKVARLCANGKDTTIGAPAAGETYERLICGSRQSFDYVVGKGEFKRNYDATVRLSTYDVWKLGSEAYVASDAFGGSKTLAADVKEACGCGQVVPGGYGK